jgi:alpha-beta hydrolase superfamily lysophospholipase
MLGLPDVAIFAWDARGHGHSSGERGSAENFGTTVKDVDAFVRHIADHHSFALENIIVLAHSVGAVSVAAWVHDYAPPIRAMILATPAFRVRLYVPLAIPSLRLKQKFLGPSFVKSYVKAKMLTHDSVQAALYDADPLIFRQIAVNVLIDLHDAGTRLLADAGINVSTLMLSAGRDWVVSLDAQQNSNGLSSSVKRMHVFPAAFAIFHEKERAQAWNGPASLSPNGSPPSRSRTPAQRRQIRSPGKNTLKTARRPSVCRCSRRYENRRAFKQRY